MPNVLDRITDKELLDFSRYFPVERKNYLGNRLFPNVKTENFTAEYERLSEGAMVPKVAMVHALDTEARIGTRDEAVAKEISKLFIKEKINMSERVRLLVSKGVNRDDAIVKYLFDDIARLSEHVLARTELMKMDLLCKGEMAIKENGLDLRVNYDVPGEHKITSDWSNPDADILGDVRVWCNLVKSKGYSVNHAITSRKVIGYILANKAIQKAINGNAMLGVMITLEQVNRLFGSLFGVVIEEENEGKFRYEQANGTYLTKDFFEQNKFILYMAAQNGSIGTGLWGRTPEEQEYGPFNSLSQKQFITVSKWSTPDPVATWTKASGLMVPVLPNPEAIIIADVDVPSADLHSLTLGGLELSPAFDKATTSYTAETSNATNMVNALAEDSNATIEVKLGGSPVPNAKAVTWSPGSNTLTVKVTNGSATKTYTVTVNKS